MPAYVIVQTWIADPEAYEDYKAQAAPIAEKYGGRPLSPDGAGDGPGDGAGARSRTFVVEFTDMSEAEAFDASPEYEALKVIHHTHPRCRLTIVEGIA